MNKIIYKTALPLFGVAFISNVQAETKSPNVLILFSDQHNASVMGCAGNDVVKTPTMDSLAKSGVLFTRAYCQAGVSVPSRTSLFSGRYPRTTGCIDNPNAPKNPEKYLMLQHLFQENGYKTGSFGKRHIARGPMSMGWDASATTINAKQDVSDENYHQWLKDNGLYDKYREDNSTKNDIFSNISNLKPEERNAAYTANKSKEFIRKRGKDNEPFFMWASFVGPHHPYTPPQKWADLYPVDDMVLPLSADEPIENLPGTDVRSRRTNVRAPWNLGSAAENKYLLKRFISYYYAQVSEVDHYMGEIVEELKRQGLYDNTIIIYTADHGDFAGEHGLAGKCCLGHNVYDATLRVPFIISWKGHIRQAKTSDEVVALLDIYPTLVDMLGLKSKTQRLQLDGEVLTNHLKTGKPMKRSYVFSENWNQLTIIGKDHKLGVWIDPGKNPFYIRRDQRGVFPDMLFDHNNDKSEMVNQIDNPKYDKVEAKMRKAMDQWVSTTSHEGRDEMIEYYLQRAKNSKNKNRVIR